MQGVHLNFSSVSELHKW